MGVAAGLPLASELTLPMAESAAIGAAERERERREAADWQRIDRGLAEAFMAEVGL